MGGDEESEESDSMISPEEKEILSRVSAIKLDFDMGGRLPEERLIKRAVGLEGREREAEKEEEEDDEIEEELTESSETDFSRRSTPYALEDMVAQVKK